jgi:hypothetical protein
MSTLKVKMKIKKLESSFIRDRWGNLTDCFWNNMIKDDIIQLEAQIN